MAGCEKILDEKEKRAAAKQKCKRKRIDDPETSDPNVSNKNPRTASKSHGKILDTCINLNK